MEQLKNALTLENFVIKDHHLNNGVGWFYNEKALCYYNCGYEAVYQVPNWEKLRVDIIRHYDWVKTEEDLYEAFSDAVSEYRLYSRG